MPFDLFDHQEKTVTQFEDIQAVLIAHDMGTGKTVTACERDKRIRVAESDYLSNVHLKGAWRTLVICPKSVFSVWEDHFAKHCPELGIATWDTNNKRKTLEKLVTAHILIINYEAIAKQMKMLGEIEWLHIICDEVHRIKNRKAQQTQAIKRLKTQWKTAMSGTPITNKPDDLWSILHWLDKKTYSSYWRFFKTYCTYDLSEQGYFVMTGVKNENRLQAEIAPIYSRITKAEALPNLPEKYYSTIRVKLGAQQRRAYNEMRKEMLAWVGQNEDQPVMAPVSVAKMVRLEQFTAAYAEVDPITGAVKLMDPSAKLDGLVEYLSDGAEQAIVFTKFKQVIPLLSQRLEQAGISYVTLTGDTKQSHRGEIVQRFQRGNVRVFAGTIAAGGVGITLTAASEVHFLDKEWQPALNAQAEDRAHREGQKNAVHIVDWVASDTVDRRKGESLQLKWSWIRKMLGE